MPNKRRWEPQAARLLASHVAFDIMFFPGWLFIGVILGRGVFSNTSIAIVIIYHIMIGLAMTSWSILGGAFFRKAQLSGIAVTIIALVMAVIAQILKPSTVAVAILGLLYPPMNCKVINVATRLSRLTNFRYLLYQTSGKVSIAIIKRLRQKAKC